MKQRWMIGLICCFWCFVQCTSPWDPRGYPCQSNQDCIDLTCVQGFCGGREVQGETTFPEREAGKEQPQQDNAQEKTPQDNPQEKPLQETPIERHQESPASTEDTKTELLTDASEPVSERVPDTPRLETEHVVEPSPPEIHREAPGERTEPVPEASCTQGQTRACYTGPASTKGQGMCKAGTQTCQQGQWGACQGEVRPATEICDSLDNDCDGKVDEGVVDCVVTIAGSGTPDIRDGLATKATLFGPTAGAWDSQSKVLYIADRFSHRIRKLDFSTQQLTTVAGSGVAGLLDDTGARAKFNEPGGLALAGQTLYIADSKNHQIRVLDLATGQVGAVAGKRNTSGAGVSGSQDGSLNQASLNTPVGLVYDGQRYLYIADSQNHVIRRLDLQLAELSTLAGQKANAGNTDGTGNQAQFNQPQGLTWDGKDTLYIADAGNHRIRTLSLSTLKVSTLAGSSAGLKDDDFLKAQFQYPQGVAWFQLGTPPNQKTGIYVADYTNARIRSLDLQSKKVSTIAGLYRGFLDGPGSQARFHEPTGVIWNGDSQNSLLWVTDLLNHRIRQIDTFGNVTTVAGYGGPGSADGSVTQATLHGPGALVGDGKGKLYFLNTGNQTLRVFDEQTGMVQTLAGKPIPLSVQDGPFSTARLSGSSYGLAWAGPHTLYMSDRGDHRIRKIDLQQKTITTVLGEGTQVKLNYPSGLAWDAKRNLLYFSDSLAHQIRQWNPSTGAVADIAGSGNKGFQDGPGATAQFDTPRGLALDPVADVLYVADSNNHRIRVITLSTQTVSTLSGNGTSGIQDGSLATATFSAPMGLAWDGSSLFTTSQKSLLIRRIDIGQKQVTTFNSGGAGGYRDGPLAQARMGIPTGIWWDASSKSLYVSDFEYHRIRRIQRK